MQNNEIPLWHLHQKFMSQALLLAQQALSEGEIPVGAIIVCNNQIVGKGFNKVQQLNDPTAHAEMIAISDACKALDNKYLSNSTMYVTLEPCIMCSGAIIWSKLERVVYGASDSKNGSGGTYFNILSNKHLNHQPEIIQGVLEKESEELLKYFFRDKRKNFLT